MNSHKKNMIASIVKEQRKNLRYTQQELADISQLSLRSVQRIEKGEVSPRMHTLKVLADCLDFSLDRLDQEKATSNDKKGVQRFRKVVPSILVSITILLMASAFIAQSSTFPETEFELLIYSAAVTGIISLVLLRQWRPNNASVHR